LLAAIAAGSGIRNDDGIARTRTYKRVFPPQGKESRNAKKKLHQISLEAMRGRMGYRLRPSWIWQRKRYDAAELVLGIANDGVAGVPGILGVYAETPDGKVRVGGNLDAGQPYAVKVRQASLVLPKGLDGKELRLRAEIEVRGVSHPLRWACREAVNSDGSLTLRLRRNDDPRFRKGV